MAQLAEKTDSRRPFFEAAVQKEFNSIHPKMFLFHGIAASVVSMKRETKVFFLHITMRLLRGSGV